MCCRHQPCTVVWCLCSREVRVSNCLCMDSLTTNYPNEFLNIIIAFYNGEKSFPSEILIVLPHFNFVVILIGVRSYSAGYFSDLRTQQSVTRLA